MSTADRMLAHHLTRFPDPETTGEIADSLHLSKAAVSAALRRLRAQGRVRRLGVAFDGSRAWGGERRPESRGATTMTTAGKIPSHVVAAWAVLPDRICPCRRKCGRTVKIVCEDGWNDIAGWLPQKVAKAPLDVDLLVQVLIYWTWAATSPAATQADFNSAYDRLETELASAVAAADDAAYLAHRGGDW